MVPPNLRSELYNLWTLFWASGVSNPINAIEQIIFLIFLKRLEESDNTRINKATNEGATPRSIFAARVDCTLEHHSDDAEGEKIGECIGHHTSRWSYFFGTKDDGTYIISDAQRPQLMLEFVFPWLRVLEKTIEGIDAINKDYSGDTSGRLMQDAYFLLDINKQDTFKKVLEIIDGLITRSANYDLMGDIFEELLKEIDKSGMNGQFRTPRHIIRFMVELIAPQMGKRIVDPAAGTGGFLINTLLYWQKESTYEGVILEWDGTPHRLHPSQNYKDQLKNSALVGYDNDRTMARIGWMNLILHGIEQPQIKLQDSLSKRRSYEENEEFDYLFANPPFAGKPDKGDLHPNFNKKNTDKTELLFIWLALELLKEGGRAAIILPEGVLFGTSSSYVDLKRELLYKNYVEAIISLPQGIFLPYTGIKTSIIVFSKGPKQLQKDIDDKSIPLTKQVVFYEVRADGYSLDNRRTERRIPNDLPDGLEKISSSIENARNINNIQENYYFTPELKLERWRIVDKVVRNAFPHLQNYKNNHYAYRLNEIFPEISLDPREAETFVVQKQQLQFEKLLRAYLLRNVPEVYNKTRQAKKLNLKTKSAENIIKTVLKPLINFISITSNQLWTKNDSSIQKGRNLWKEIQIEVQATVTKEWVEWILQKDQNHVANEPSGEILAFLKWRNEIALILKEFFKLDGYDIWTRSEEVIPVSNSDARSIEQDEPHLWSAPVISYLKNQDGTDTETIDPSCIAGNAFNLSARLYKPLLSTREAEGNALDVINRIEELEQKIFQELKTLKELLETRS